MLLREEVEKVLTQVISIASKQGKLTGFCIGNTRKISSTDMYLTPIRHSSKLISGSVIVYSVKQAGEVASYVDGKVDYVLVDTEKKVSSVLYGYDIGNIERSVRETIRISRVLTFKGNDLTVNSIDAFLEQVLVAYPRGLGGKSVAIIGAGNIGSKLALKLVERGMNVTITRRDKTKLATIVDALNIIKPKETAVSVRGTTNNLAAARNVDVLIGLSAGSPVITAEMIECLNDEAVVLDGGKGCIDSGGISLAERNNVPIYRVDVRSGFEGFITSALTMERIVTETIGRDTINGVPVVSGGLLGRVDEVVVDNVNNPQAVFGLADGSGDFHRILSDTQRGRIDTVQHFIDRNKMR